MAEKFNFQKISEGNTGKDLNTKSSREWFRNLAMGVKKMSISKFKKDTTPFQNVENLSINSIGKLYSFSYSAKWKDTLPYWDKFPLVFPFDLQNDRMLGINLHYLPTGARARLMDRLYDTLNNEKYNKTTKLKINYGILKSLSTLVKPCIHCYLFDHVTSPFIYQSPDLWDYTIMLPLAQFQKKTADQVWLESMLKV